MARRHVVLQCVSRRTPGAWILSATQYALPTLPAHGQKAFAFEAA
jgi:hypothetical protein